MSPADAGPELAAPRPEPPVQRVCLVVLDGWGLAEQGPGNAVSLARTPVFDRLWENNSHTTLAACGAAVGLPDGQMGNSEVGHLNLGAGSIVRQDLVRISEAVERGALGEIPALRELLTSSPRIHLIGLVSDGGVHSSLEHLHALIELARELGTQELIVHCFTDGRDTLPRSAAGFLRTVEEWCAEGSGGGASGRTHVRVGSLIGRYYAMDRDGRWERIQLAYDLLVHGRAAHHAETALAAVEAAYERGESDEFVMPTTIGAAATIAPDDGVLCFNFRPDRMRELTRALAEPGFGDGVEALSGWSGRGGAGPLARLGTLTEYSEAWPYPVAFQPAHPSVTLASVIADAAERQLHVAETEKYPHVTYFFNGGREEPLRGERRELVASPRDVATYEQKPEMSARGVTEAFVSAFREDRPRLAVLNFANPDMVGHTGVIAAAVKAVETVDACLGEVVDAVHGAGGVCLVTADHGNAEHLLEDDGGPNTAHTLNPVPLVVTRVSVGLRQHGGVLADVAPTILELLGISQPAQMSGRSLIDHDGESLA